MIREHFTKGGTPKKSYPSRISAEFIGNNYNQEAYECGFCGKWHLGKRKDDNGKV